MAGPTCRYSSACSSIGIETDRTMSETQRAESAGRDPRFQDSAADGSKLLSKLAEAEGRAALAERRLREIETSRAWRVVRRYRSARKRLARRSVVDDAKPNRLPVGTKGETLEAQVRVLHDRMKRWAQDSRKATGRQVVAIFSDAPAHGTSGGTRAFGLTKALLADGCPVFYGYFRNQIGPLPAGGTPELLMQSPIDATARILPHLLESDFGTKDKILIAAFPHEVMVRYMLYAAQNGWKVVSDVGEDWEEFERVGAAPWYEPAYERYVTDAAHAVVVASSGLAKKIAATSGRTATVVPNAGDETFMAADVFAGHGFPILGYFGSLTDRWFDWKLLMRAARRHTDVRFELIGFHEPPGVVYPANVTYLGNLDPTRVVAAAARWRAAIIPYSIGPLVDAFDPIIAYDFVRLGLPTLATHSPQLAAFPGFTVAESPESFVEMIGGLATRDRRDHVIPDEWLAQNTWDVRLAQYRRVIVDDDLSRSMSTYLVSEQQ